jgi:hypothetical protein
LRLEDVIFAFKEIGEKPIILLALSCTVVRHVIVAASNHCTPSSRKHQPRLSIAFFNFAGVTVTKKLSATTRLDS